MKTPIITLMIFCFFLTTELYSNNFEIQKELKETDEQLEKLQYEINWFLDHIKPIDDKDKSQSSDFLEKWKDEYEQELQAIDDLQKEFLLFREKLATALSARFEQSRYKSFTYSKCLLNTTKWYADYIEKNLFPSNWKELYQKYLQQKNSPSIKEIR